MAPFDPSAAAAPGSGIFGLTTGPEAAEVHVLGVPFDATASYGRGTFRGPEAVLAASRQVELYDLATGRPYEAGIHMPAIDPRLITLAAEAAGLVDEIRDGSLEHGKHECLDVLCEEMNEIVRGAVAAVLADGKLPCLVGGDHSVSFGALQACAERHPGLGILQFDAHADLRVAYEDFEWSHASVMHNAMSRLPGVSRLVQVGLRDVCEEELAAIHASDGRIAALFDRDWARARLEGVDLLGRMRAHLALLPQTVYVTFDIDALDPSLCPHTGTPVPGGLTWHEAEAWLEALAATGRRIVGLDVTEVAPPIATAGKRDSLDAIVGARLLYRLVGTAKLAHPAAPSDSITP